MQLLFPTPVLLKKIEREDIDDLNRKLIRDSFVDLQRTTESRTGLNGAKQTEPSLQEKFPSFRKLCAYLRGEVAEFVESVGIPADFTLGSFWANNLSKPGQFHMPHMHGHGKTLFCGVYYPASALDLEGNPVEVEPKGLRMTYRPEPGDLVLIDPATVAKYQLPHICKHTSEFYGSPYAYTPQTSEVIMFPHYLTHLVAPLIDPDIQRISIAFHVHAN